MIKIMKIKEWLEYKSQANKLPRFRNMLLDDIVSITPFSDMPKGTVFYLDAKYDKGDRITGDLPFED